MASIKEWFETKDYDQGLGLLARHSRKRALIQNLTRKKNPKKLEYELRKIEKSGAKPVNDKKNQVKMASSQPQKTGSVPDPDPGRLKIVRENKELSVDDLPRDLKALWEANRDAYKEIRSLHEKLKLLEKAQPQDRKPIVDRIVNLDNMIRENWAVIDNWNPNENQNPEKDTGKSIDHRRINANRKYISTGLRKIQGGKLDQKKMDSIRGQIKSRYIELKSAGVEMSEDTIEEMKTAGIDL